MNEPDVTLPTNAVSFQAENGRDWVVRFWEIPGKWVGIAFPFGFVLWVLFYFDHNVSVRASALSLQLPFFPALPSAFPLPPSPATLLARRSEDRPAYPRQQSLIAQGSEFPLKKPPGFHWDFFLLGFVIFLSGLFGLPASNGMSLSPLILDPHLIAAMT